MADYASALASSRAAYDKVLQGYSTAADTAVAGLAGSNQAAKQNIYDQYVGASGKASQDLVSRGLGNSTIRSSVQRGLLQSKWKSDLASDNALAQQISGIRSQYGLAALGTSAQFAGQEAQLGYNYASLSGQEQQRAIDNAFRQSQFDWQKQQRLFGGGGGGSGGGGGGRSSGGGGGGGQIRGLPPGPGFVSSNDKLAAMIGNSAGGGGGGYDSSGGGALPYLPGYGYDSNTGVYSYDSSLNDPYNQAPGTGANAPTYTAPDYSGNDEYYG